MPGSVPPQVPAPRPERRDLSSACSHVSAPRRPPHPSLQAPRRSAAAGRGPAGERSCRTPDSGPSCPARARTKLLMWLPGPLLVAECEEAVGSHQHTTCVGCRAQKASPRRATPSPTVSCPELGRPAARGTRLGPGQSRRSQLLGCKLSAPSAWFAAFKDDTRGSSGERAWPRTCREETRTALGAVRRAGRRSARKPAGRPARGFSNSPGRFAGGCEA